MTTYRVVIVDDVAECRDMVGLMLATAGSEFLVVGQACDGAEAVEMVATLQPDIVLLDLAMPVMDGLQALPQIKQRAPRTKVLIHSAFSDARLGTEVLEAGADGYLVKDGSRRSLLQAIRGLETGLSR